MKLLATVNHAVAAVKPDHGAEGRLNAVRITRRLAGFLLAVAAWNVISYANFARNLADGGGHPVGYYAAHVILIVVNLAIAAVLGVVGWRAWRAAGHRGGPVNVTPAA